MDVAGILYGMGSPVFAVLAVDAEISTGIVTATIRVIDDTRAKVQASGSAEVRSVGPGAFARLVELAAHDIGHDDLVDSSLSFNGRTWIVRSYEIIGSPQGEDAGEVRLLLKADNG